MTPNEGIGARIKARRLDLKITQKELAAKCGYTSHTSIAKIEKGGVDLPQSKILIFADALQTSVDYIMGWDSQASLGKTDLSVQPLSVAEWRLLNTFRDLTPANQHAIIDNAEFLLSRQGSETDQKQA